MRKKLVFTETSIDDFSLSMVTNLSIVCDQYEIDLYLFVSNLKQELFWKKRGFNATSFKVDKVNNLQFPYEITQHLRTLGKFDENLIDPLPSESAVTRKLKELDPIFVLSFVGPEAFKHSIKSIANSMNIGSKFLDFCPIPGRMALVETCFSALNLKKVYEGILEPSVESQELFTKLKSMDRIASVRSDRKPESVGFLDTFRNKKADFLSRFRNIRSQPSLRQINSFSRQLTKTINYLLIKLFSWKLWRVFISKSDKQRVVGFITFAMQTSTETAFSYGSRLFSTPEQAFLEYSKYFKLSEDILYRLHPMAASLLSTSTILKSFVGGNKVSCYESSSKEVFGLSKAIVVWNGNIGFEALLQGKKVITLGNSYYSGLGLTYDIFTYQELREINTYFEDEENSTYDLTRLVDSILTVSFKGNIDKDGFDQVMQEIISNCESSENVSI
tara:strand:- start:1852 stop:3186 length:1335 start_codon:yes stop_codon:yes gene_type:complete